MKKIKVEPLTPLDIEKRASDTRDKIDLKNPSKTTIKLQLEDIYGYSLVIEPNIVPEGITDFSNKHLILREDVYKGLIENMPRERFTAAHELGHICLHTDQLKESISYYRNSKNLFTNKTDVKPYEDIDWQTNYYARVFLMPLPDMFEKMKLSTPIEKEELYKYFNVEEKDCLMRVEDIIRLFYKKIKFNDYYYQIIE